MTKSAPRSEKRNFQLARSSVAKDIVFHLRENQDAQERLIQELGGEDQFKARRDQLTEELRKRFRPATLKAKAKTEEELKTAWVDRDFGWIGGVAYDSEEVSSLREKINDARSSESEEAKNHFISQNPDWKDATQPSPLKNHLRKGRQGESVDLRKHELTKHFFTQTDDLENQLKDLKVRLTPSIEARYNQLSQEEKQAFQEKQDPCEGALDIGFISLQRRFFYDSEVRRLLLDKENIKTIFLASARRDNFDSIFSDSNGYTGSGELSLTLPGFLVPDKASEASADQSLSLFSVIFEATPSALFEMQVNGHQGQEAWLDFRSPQQIAAATSFYETLGGAFESFAQDAFDQYQAPEKAEFERFLDEEYDKNKADQYLARFQKMREVAGTYAIPDFGAERNLPKSDHFWKLADFDLERIFTPVFVHHVLDPRHLLTFLGGADHEKLFELAQCAMADGDEKYGKYFFTALKSLEFNLQKEVALGILPQELSKDAWDEYKQDFLQTILEERDVAEDVLQQDGVEEYKSPQGHNSSPNA